jgi:hypothetical protein
MFGFFKKAKKTSKTEGGSTIYNYSTSEEKIGTESMGGGESKMEAITAHIEKYLGKIDMVYHELISPLVHIDIHVIYPKPERDFYTLITTGMSDKPMHVPTKEHKPWEYGEFMICLPKEWKLDDESLKNEDYYWPIRMMKFMARFPHEYKSWLSFGHTLPNGNPSRTYTDKVGFTGVLVDLPVTIQNIKFPVVQIDEQTKVFIYAPYPVYENEMEFKLKNGNDALIELFDENNITELLDPNRKSVIG